MSRHPIQRAVTRASSAILVAAALTSPTFAADLAVPSSFPTIQSAVDAALSGDTITISAGNYVENVVVPAGKDGLMIAGKGRVLWDGQLAGPGLTIMSNDVTVKSVTIRHAAEEGIRAKPPEGPSNPERLEGITILDVIVINSGDEAIFALANDAMIRNVRAKGCDGGIEAKGARVVIEKCRVTLDADSGIELVGDDGRISMCTASVIEDGIGIAVSGQSVVIEGNSIDNTCGELIFVEGDDAQILRNKGRGSGDVGIGVEGNGALIDRNTVVRCADTLIEVDGDDITITNNRVTGSDEDGIEVDGLGALIARNQVADTGEDSDGICVSSLTGATIEKNRVTNAFECGMRLFVEGATIRMNQVMNSGSEDDAGLVVFGSDNTIDGNTVRDCDSTGIEVDGSRNVIVGNTSANNTDNGIHLVSIPFGGAALGDGGIPAFDNVLDGNLCANNSGEGIENEAVATIVVSNKMRANRLDLTNRTSLGASLIDGGGNTFKTGGLTVEPEID